MQPRGRRSNDAPQQAGSVLRGVRGCADDAVAGHTPQPGDGRSGRDGGLVVRKRRAVGSGDRSAGAGTSGTGAGGAAGGTAGTSSSHAEYVVKLRARSA